MAQCRFIYGVIKKYLCLEGELHVHYISIDDFVITTPLKKRYSHPLVMALVDLVHLVLGQDVASLLSLCMAKWLRKWQWGWLYVRSNTKNAKSLFIFKRGVIIQIAPGEWCNNIFDKQIPLIKCKNNTILTKNENKRCNFLFCPSLMVW